MVPEAKLLVFYITASGEIISDTVGLEFGDELRNFVRQVFHETSHKLTMFVQVDLKVAKQAEPGDVLTISVKSQPKSYVGLLGVDQSVLLLKTGNDIEKAAVADELRLYSSIDRYNDEWLDNEYYSYYTDFWLANILVMTNAKPEYREFR